jgi:signal transduction histidine kinase
LAEDQLVVSIEDTGIGISERQLRTIFDTFGNSEEETSSNYGGDVRLGLPLAHRYCSLIGGTLSVQSQVGVGSTFTVAVPVGRCNTESSLQCSKSGHRIQPAVQQAA